MSDEQETSPSGQPVYRHQELSGWESGDSSPYHDQIQAHIERYVGPITTVFHEIASNRVHVDVLVVAPRPDRDCWTFVTCGMSARPMNVPAEAVAMQPPLAELMIMLPADWPFSSQPGDLLGKSAHDYPISLLRSLAHFPHDYASWLGAGHTIPNGDPPEPLSSDTAMCACMLTPVLGADRAFNRLSLDDGVEIAFYAAVPLYEEELSLKLNEGADRLYDLFDEHGVWELFDPQRPSVVPRPKPPGLLSRWMGRP